MKIDMHIADESYCRWLETVCFRLAPEVRTCSAHEAGYRYGYRYGYHAGLAAGRRKRQKRGKTKARMI